MLIRAVVRAHRSQRRIDSGQAKSITDLAEREGVNVAYVCRLLPLTCLAPEIVEAVLDGRQPKGLRLAEMLGNGSPDWNEQRTAWGVRAVAPMTRLQCLPSLPVFGPRRPRVPLTTDGQIQRRRSCR
jgi:hypothetical protein